MPKVGCLCGFVHNLSPIPDAGYIVVRDVDYERLIAEECDRAGRPAGSAATTPGTISKLRSRLYECPDCRRLAWLKGGDRVVFFRPEIP